MFIRAWVRKHGSLLWACCECVCFFLFCLLPRKTNANLFGKIVCVSDMLKKCHVFSSVLFFGLCAHTSVRVLKRQQNMLSVVRKRQRQAAGWQDENQIRPFCYRSQCWATAENSQTIIVFPWRQAYFAGRSSTNDDTSAESCLKSFFPMRRQAGRLGEAARDSVVRHAVGFPVTSFSLSRVSESRSFQRHSPLFGSSFSSFPLYSFFLFPHVPSAPVHPPLLTARLF